MLHVAQVIDTCKVGGAQSLLITFAETVPAGAVTLTVITLNPVPDTPVAARLATAGVRVQAVPGRGLLDLRRFWRLVHALRSGSYTLVHTHLTYANILGVAAARLARLPVAGTLHNVQPSHQAAPQRVMEGLALRHGADALLAVGAQVADAYRQRWPDLDIHVLANAIALPEPLPQTERGALRRQLVGDSVAPLLVAVGRLTAQKGYPDMLAAFARVLKTHPDASLLIAGTGEEKEGLAGQIAALNLEERVHLLGLRDDVPALLGAADLFVSASHWEGMPVALLEAMGAGLPVVATAVGDVPAVVTADSGLLVPPQQPAALADAINTLLQDPARRRRMGVAAREHVAHQYSARAWTRQLLDVYRQLAAPAAGAVEAA